MRINIESLITVVFFFMTSTLILVIGWIIGVVGYSLGGLIHVLIVIAIVAILLDLIRGRRPV